MSYRKKVYELAKSMGATIGQDSGAEDEFRVQVEAPENHHWIDGTVHELIGSQFKGFNTEELWKDLLERMECGTEECNEECEWWE